MKIKKNDFVEIEFTARTKDGKVFDTNIKSEAEKAGLKIKNLKPFVLSVGHHMLIKGLDKELEGKEVGKKYSVELKPEEAFGKRNPEMIKMIPLKKFTEQKINPQRGMQLTIDGIIVKVLSVSGGRVLVDFNNPLAGKNVIYNFKINRKVEDINEKINALQDFFFKKRFKFDVDKNKKIITFKLPQKEKQFENFMKIVAKPFKEILNMEIKAEIEEPAK